jgi:hypothetical protein
VKKIIAIFFLITYGFTSIGATLHEHYCMNEYVGTTMWKATNERCGKCGMKEDASKKGCCKDEQKEFKLKTDHEKTNTAKYVKIFFLVLHTQEFFLFNIAIAPASKQCYTNYRPPPDIGIYDLQVLHCTFLI